MKSATINELIIKVSEYNIKSLKKVLKAYEYANDHHKGQLRQSGEPYIIHPLTVCYILAQLHADEDTLCAALLHDTLEDTDSTYEEIEELFGHDVAVLVDGVTKISKMNFTTKEEEISANARKIITSITTDIRIIIIKLADRLHNMNTLEFKKPHKQKENAIETMEIFVPIAYQIGAYRIKGELEDLSLRYIDPYSYESIKEELEKVKEDTEDCINEVTYKITKILSDTNIPNEIKVRTKNIYGVYKRKMQGHRTYDIHDLLSLKIMVDEIDDCYRLLRPIHQTYKPINDKFKDYICNPKTNMYQSLHTTVFGPDSRLVQMQIRTFEMDKIASFGITTYWDLCKENAKYMMQQQVENNFQFYRPLKEINKAYKNDYDFLNQAKKELLSEKIYVYTATGEVVELPVGSTVIDLAYKIGKDLGDKLVAVKVNDKVESLNYKLKNKDRVIIITDKYQTGPKQEWINIVETTEAKEKIKRLINM